MERELVRIYKRYKLKGAPILGAEPPQAETATDAAQRGSTVQINNWHACPLTHCTKLTALKIYCMLLKRTPKERAGRENENGI